MGNSGGKIPDLTADSNECALGPPQLTGQFIKPTPKAVVASAAAVWEATQMLMEGPKEGGGGTCCHKGKMHESSGRRRRGGPKE